MNVQGIKKLLSEDRHLYFFLFYHALAIIAVVIAEIGYMGQYPERGSGGYSLMLLPVVIVPFGLIHLLYIALRKEKFYNSWSMGKLIKWNVGMFFIDCFMVMMLLTVLYGA